MDKLIVTLSFDDGRIDTYTKAYAIMKKYNLVGTVHVITGYVDGTFTRQLSGSKGAMTVGHLIEMKKAGWEISSHGDRHVTEKQDFLQSVEKLKEWKVVDKVGFSIPESRIVYEDTEDFIRFLQENNIAYMRGGRDKRCYRFSSKVFYALYRVFHSKLCYRVFYRYCFMKPESADRYRLVAAVVRREDCEEAVIDLLRRHAGKKEWIIFMLHSITDEEDCWDEKSPWGWSERRFTAVCEYLKKLVEEGKAEVRTIMDVVGEIQ